MGTVHIFINPIEILTTMRGYLQDQNFSHVRLPIEWGEHFNASSELTKEITEVVDFAISLGLGIGECHFFVAKLWSTTCEGFEGLFFV